MSIVLDEELLNFHTQMVDITIKTGHSPCQWHIGIDMMIKKKPINYSVKNLQMILLFDVKFNSILKWLGWQIMIWVEQLNALAIEQYGSHHGLAAIQHSLNYQLILDVVWQLHTPAVICSNDAKACYDCIVHAFSSLALQHLSIPQGPIQVMFGIIQMLKHYIHMAFGDSKKFFLGTRNGCLIQGVGQGNGVGLQIWVAMSFPFFDLIWQTNAGIHLISNISKNEIQFAGLGFVDDANLLSVNNVHQVSMTHTFDNLQVLLNEWEAGLHISGGALSTSKSLWTAIDFPWDKNRWAYKSVAQLLACLFMWDVSGQREQLSCLEPWEAEHALGIRLAADGNMNTELEYCIKQAQEWAHQVSQVQVSKMSMWINFHSVLLQQLEYPLMATTFSKE